MSPSARQARTSFIPFITTRRQRGPRPACPSTGPHASPRYFLPPCLRLHLTSPSPPSTLDFSFPVYITRARRIRVSPPLPSHPALLSASTASPPSTDRVKKLSVRRKIHDHGGHGQLHRHHPRHHPPAPRRLPQVRMRARVLDLPLADLPRVHPGYHLRHLRHHQVN